MSPNWKTPENWKRSWVLGGVAAVILAVVLVGATVALTNDEAESSGGPTVPPTGRSRLHRRRRARDVGGAPAVPLR